MYKSKLQELCHQKQWSLPQYSTTKEGPNHVPRFTTTVTLNGLSFQTPNPSKSSKDSQNEAAKLAFDHLTAPPKPPTEPSPITAAETTDNSSGSHDMSDMLASLEGLQPKLQEEYLSPGVTMAEACQSPQVKPPEECHALPISQSSPIVIDDAPVRDVWHLSKNQLQMYAQKRNLPLPTYTCERVGPPHASRFRCKVTVDGKTFEGPDFCSTLKDAEHAAARVALLTLSSNGEQESDSGLYKNLLQEFAQREGYHLPVYETNGSGGHFLIFTSTVLIGGESFTGQQGRTKKQAEMNAAKVAYTLLKERKRSQTSTSQCPAHQGPRAFSPFTTSQLNATPGNPLSIGPRLDAASNFTLLTRREHGIRESGESKNHDLPLPSPEAETSTLTSEALLGPLPSDAVYAQLRNPTLEESSSGSSSPSENGNVLAVVDATIASPGEVVSLPPHGVVRVYAQALNVTLPEGSVVAFSDENWVAVVAGPDPN